MAYRIDYSPAALRAIAKLPARDAVRIVERIDRLAANPRPPGSVKLKGTEGEYRVRAGDFRILYSIFDAVLVVVIIDVGNRRDVYRRR